eukprot:3508166-Rhodomonas_salina.1
MGLEGGGAGLSLEREQSQYLSREGKSLVERAAVTRTLPLLESQMWEDDIQWGADDEDDEKGAGKGDGSEKDEDSDMTYRPMRCPVLTWATPRTLDTDDVPIVLCSVRYCRDVRVCCYQDEEEFEKDDGFDQDKGSTFRCDVRYWLVYATTVRDVMCGTDIAYEATIPRAIPGTDQGCSAIPGGGGLLGEENEPVEWMEQ